MKYLIDYFLRRFTELNQSFVSALDERIAKRLPGGGGYYTKAMPLDPAIGFAMVVLLFS